MASTIFIARDDAGGKDMTLGPLEWSVQQSENTFGGIQVFPGFAFNSSDPELPVPLGSAQISFDGVAISVYGTTSASPHQDFLVSIDTAEPYNTSTGDTRPQNYKQWYESPQLAPSLHTLNISNIRATSIDLLLITPGPDTSLSNQTLLVDDSYQGIKYSGSGWTSQTNRTFARSATVPALPILNGTHQTTTTGDSLFFAFSGTRARIYGNILAGNASSITLAYSVDKDAPKTVVHNYRVPSTGNNNPSAKPNDNLNVLLVDTEDLTIGKHSVQVTLTEAKNCPLIVDYIVYQPSFTSLRSLPDLSSMTPSPFTTQTLTSSIPTSSAQSSSLTTATKSKVNIGAIVGGVVGGLVAFALLALAVLLLLRSKRRNREFKESDLQPSPFVDLTTTPMAETNSHVWPSPTSSKAQRMRNHNSALYSDQDETRSPDSLSPPSISFNREEFQRRLQALSALLMTPTPSDNQSTASPTTGTASQSSRGSPAAREPPRSGREVKGDRQRLAINTRVREPGGTNYASPTTGHGSPATPLRAPKSGRDVKAARINAWSQEVRRPGNSNTPPAYI